MTSQPRTLSRQRWEGVGINRRLRGGRGVLGPGQANLRQLLIPAICTAAGIGAFILIRIVTT